MNILAEPQTAQEIATEIESFMQSRGGQNQDWYVGITKNIGSRLFGDHRVYVNDHRWIFCQATSSEHARAAEAHFLALGCDGGPGGGTEESCFVYAYLKHDNTRP